jgi:hypothetical protein
MTTLPRGAAVLTVGLVLAGCADHAAPPPGPVGVAAEDFPPGALSPEGQLGGAEVGADTLADPALETAGDPFL